MNNLQKRIGYLGDLVPLLSKVCDDYNIGKYLSHSLILMGYEDFNLIVKTTCRKFFCKIFAAFRDKKNCERYIQILKNASKSGINLPTVYQSTQGSVYETVLEDKPIRLCIMQYINGQTLFESQKNLSEKDILMLIKDAARINKISYKPSFDYDSWAITNFLQSWKERKQYLSEEDRGLISPLVFSFHTLKLQTIPHCFVHGDLIKTNIIRDNKDKLYIIDFSVANYYPQIVEIAVLLCDVLFNKNNLDLYADIYTQTLRIYQKHIPFNKHEIDCIPIFIQVAHAMHLLCATYEKKAKNNKTKENEYFIESGRKGLQFTSQFFKNYLLE